MLISNVLHSMAEESEQENSIRFKENRKQISEFGILLENETKSEATCVVDNCEFANEGFGYIYRAGNSGKINWGYFPGKWNY